MNRIAFLKSTTLLSGASENTLREIYAGMRERALAAGDGLFLEGDAGDAAYLVVEGKLRLERHGVTLMAREQGSWVGEFALIDNQPRSTSAIAETAVILLQWPRDEFREVIAKHADVASGVFKELTAKLRQDVDIRVDLELAQERWRQDLKRAREIQMGMLPHADLLSATTELSGYCRPAAEVGGDYYDYLELEKGQLGVIIGDVTGHGFYAGLFVAMAKSCLKTQSRFDYTPQSVMDAMRETLALSIQRSLLMTCCYVLLDPPRERLTYANAGHPYPYLYRAHDERLDKLEALDPLLGLQDLYQDAVQHQERSWMPGDLLVIYSDGITEARNADGDMFGHERLEQCIWSHRRDSARRIKQTILEALFSHAGDQDYTDDLTLVVVRAL